MDHLHASGNSHLLAIEVPFICTEEPTCKASDFLHWPCQLSWAKVNSQHALAARAQSWLYFGLLAAFLDENFDREELSRVSPSGHRIIDSSSLERRILNWEEKLRAQSGSVQNGRSSTEAIGLDLLADERFRAERIVTCAILAMNHDIIPALNRLESSSDIDVWTSVSHAVILSIDILIDLLIGGIRYLSNPEVGLLTGDVGPGRLPRRALTAENRILARSLLRAGRCPSICWRFRPSSSNFYALLILPQIVIGQDHSKCPSIKCTANNINFNTYETVHTTSCEGCQHVPVNVDDVVKCIKNGGIPLIALVENSKGRLEAKIVERTTKHQYVAISHVWSGGLGNFRSNSLPDCQLRRLGTLLSNLPSQPPELFESLVPFPIKHPSVLKTFQFPSNILHGAHSHLFWMDSLCIPVGEDLKLYRKDAIKSMAEIYAAATSILVIDPELQQISLRSNGLDMNSITRYIQCSPWMARSWTLQEGALALEVFLVFKDGTRSARNLLALIRRQIPHTPILTRQGLDVPWQRILDFESSGFQSYSVSEYKLNRFISAWNGLCTRSTTQREDVPGIFAVLVGLSPKEILSFPMGEGIKAAIKAQELIPLSVLYQSLMPSGSRLGDQWNPPFPGLDDINNVTCPLDINCGILQVTNDGFIIKDPGYGLVAFMIRGEPPTSKKLYLRDQRTKEEVWIHMNISDEHYKDFVMRKLVFLFTPVPALGRDGMPGAVFTVESYNSEILRLSYVSSITAFFSPQISFIYEFVDAEHWAQPGTLTKKILIEAGKKSVRHLHAQRRPLV
jgi:hypothetical protein